MRQQNLVKLFAKNIKKKRALRKMSLAELAKLSGLSKSLISRIELEERHPTIDSIEKISTALGMDVSEIFGPSRGSICLDTDIMDSVAKKFGFEPQKWKRVDDKVDTASFIGSYISNNSPTYHIDTSRSLNIIESWRSTKGSAVKFEDIVDGKSSNAAIKCVERTLMTGLEGMFICKDNRRVWRVGNVYPEFEGTEDNRKVKSLVVVMEKAVNRGFTKEQCAAFQKIIDKNIHREFLIIAEDMKVTFVSREKPPLKPPHLVDAYATTIPWNERDEVMNVLSDAFNDSPHAPSIDVKIFGEKLVCHFELVNISGKRYLICGEEYL